MSAAEQQGMREIHVQPGESHLVKEPMILRTVLGSCVGITWFVLRLGIGALCHPMLPLCPKRSGGGMSVAEGRRYVDFTIEDLARQLDLLGALRSEVEVKMFGGGDVLLVSNNPLRPTVGRLNCEAAMRALEDGGFRVAASSVGGACGITIQFNTETGDVILRRLS